MRLLAKGKGLLANLGLEDDTILETPEADTVELGEGEAVVDVNEDGVPVDTSETADAALVDVVEDGAELDTAVDVAEDLQADEVTLESIHVALKASLESGGLDKKAATMMQIAVEAICGRWGMTANMSIPALESFGGTASRTASTTVAIESVGGALKQFAVAIQRQIAKIWEYLTNFIERVWNAAGRTRKNAEALIAKAKGQEGKPGGEGEVEVPKAGRIALAGKVATESELEHALTETKGLLHAYSQADVALMLKGTKEGGEAPGAMGEKLKAMPGKGSEGEVAGKAPRLSADQVAKLAQLVADNCKMVEDFKKDWAIRTQTKDSILKPLIAQLNQEGELGEAAKATLSEAHAIIGKMSSDTTALNSYVLNLAGGVLAYGQASLAEAKEAAPAAAPAATPEPAPAA